jgi:hypothetical protein
LNEGPAASLHSLANGGAILRPVSIEQWYKHCIGAVTPRMYCSPGSESSATIEIHNNTFRAPQPSVVIRGVPQEKCDVHHNWFVKHGKPADAVKAADMTKTENNIYGEKPQAAQ